MKCLRRGERKLFQMVDVASGFEQSIYDDRHTAKGETSILQARSDALRQPRSAMPSDLRVWLSGSKLVSS